MTKKSILILLSIVILYSCGSGMVEDSLSQKNDSLSITVELTTGFIPVAINFFGDIAGWHTTTEGIRKSAMYSGTTVKDLKTSQFSMANALNKQGFIVGVQESYGKAVAFISFDDAVSNIGDNYYSESKDINNAGEVVGYYYSGSETLAFYYKNGVLTSLGTLRGVSSSASSINTVGQIAGYSEIDGFYHAFLYENGVMKDLGTLGGDNSSALDLNDFGQVVGFSEVGEAYHAFLHKNGVMKDLGTLGGGFSSAEAINNSGIIVGWSFDQAGNKHAFIYEKGVMFDLNTLYPRVDCIITEATDINDAGQIVTVCEMDELRKKALIIRHGV